MISEAARKYVYYEEAENGIVLLHGNCLEILPQLELESIQCCVTSPPYWGLRDYGESDQIGLERTPLRYSEQMTEVFAGINNILKPDGTLWLNLGDSYASFRDSKCVPQSVNGDQRSMPKQGASNRGAAAFKNSTIKHKDLVGIPWRVAFALQANGWYLRSDIIWDKPNPMPESVTDRPTKSHEYLFLMAKSEKYYYDHEAIREPFADSRLGKDGGIKPSLRNRGGRKDGFTKPSGIDPSKNDGRNKRSVWTIPIKPYKGAHFAVFPEELIEPCILAGTKEGDIVIDPFNGSGTTGMVCKKLNRKYIGIELNEEYLKLNSDRIGKQERLF
jgi:DNA modification methylase